MKKFTKEWLINALFRAIRTFAQTALSMFTIGAAFNEVDWLRILSVSGVAFIYSILTSLVTGLPEAEQDGVLMIDTSGETDKWLFQVDTPVDKISSMKSVRLRVDSNAHFKDGDIVE